MESATGATSVPPGRETALHRFTAQLPIEEQRTLSAVVVVAASLFAHGIADHLAHKLHEDLSGELVAFTLLLVLLQLDLEMPPPPVRQRRPEVLTTMCLFILLGAVICLAFVKALWIVSDFKGHFVLLLINIPILAFQSPPSAMKYRRNSCFGRSQ